jgi:WhiB family redox-sensing transcriptional regulator
MKDFIHLRDARAEWMRDAACRGVDDIDFFPESMTTISAARAVALCNQCPVQEACARYAMVNDIEYGIWGGLSPRARREIATSRTRRAREKETKTYETYMRFKGENRSDPVKATARELEISTATVYHHIRIVKFRHIFEAFEPDQNGDSATDQTGRTHNRRQN